MPGTLELVQLDHRYINNEDDKIEVRARRYPSPEEPQNRKPRTARLFWQNFPFPAPAIDDEGGGRGVCW